MYSFLARPHHLNRKISEQVSNTIIEASRINLALVDPIIYLEGVNHFSEDRSIHDCDTEIITGLAMGCDVMIVYTLDGWKEDPHVNFCLGIAHDKNIGVVFLEEKQKINDQFRKVVAVCKSTFPQHLRKI